MINLLNLARIVLWRGLVAVTIIISCGLTKISPAVAAPSIGNLSDNRSIYTNSQIPKYEKFEINFTIGNSVASNFFFPYSDNVPSGLTAGTGITVNAEFLAPGETDWTKAFITPAFYYQDFEYAVKENRDWIHANGNFYWKARFAPDREGSWQYRLTVRDKSGSATSSIQSFTTVGSANHGFVKVSQTDKRYFEFEDGTFFPGVGFNLHYDGVEWKNPVLGNQARFAVLKQKGVELVRIWQSFWSIFGSWANPWHYIGNSADYTWLTGQERYGQSDFSLSLQTGLTSADRSNPCVSYGGWVTYNPAIKPSTTYRIRVRAKTTQMGVARASGSPYGLVVKTGGWLDNCANSGVGSVKSSYLSGNSDWTTLTGSYTSGSSENFLPMLYIALENITTGHAYIDYVWVEEDLGNGQNGTNVIPKPWMSHYQYIDQRNAYGFDKMLEQAKKYDVYLKVVGLEKNDVIPNLVNWDGTIGTNEQNNNNFYGNYGEQTKIYWLQQAWWRYQQARWGYSTNIHSWELLNEGDPYNGNHWKQADEMGKYMHCRVFGISLAKDDGLKCNNSHPNKHLTTTSLWDRFPAEFWGGSKWPNVDYADVHAYVSTSFTGTAVKDLMKYDAAYYHQWHSEQLNLAGNNPNKPIIRGEAGLDIATSQDPNALGLSRDTGFVWLHNYLWAGLYHGGLYEQYWWWREHMTDSSGNIDPKGHMPAYYRFIKDLPLNKGGYQNAEAVVENSIIRAWGQKDTANNRAHLWIQNSKHTWKNVVDNVSIQPVSTIVNVSGFTPNKDLKVEWWDTYGGSVSSTTNIRTNSQGELVLSVSNLATDTAVKIGDYSTYPVGTPTSGDADGDGDVDIYDYNKLIADFGKSGSPADFNGNGVVDIFDYNILIGNFGK